MRFAHLIKYETIEFLRLQCKLRPNDRKMSFTIDKANFISIPHLRPRRAQGVTDSCKAATIASPVAPSFIDACNVVCLCFQGLHEDWIRKVKYYPSLQCFISCATASNTSMYLGDIDRKKTLVQISITGGSLNFSCHYA